MSSSTSKTLTSLGDLNYVASASPLAMLLDSSFSFCQLQCFKVYLDVSASEGSLSEIGSLSESK